MEASNEDENAWKDGDWLEHTSINTIFEIEKKKKTRGNRFVKKTNWNICSTCLHASNKCVFEELCDKNWNETTTLAAAAKKNGTM